MWNSGGKEGNTEGGGGKEKQSSRRKLCCHHVLSWMLVQVLETVRREEGVLDHWLAIDILCEFLLYP